MDPYFGQTEALSATSHRWWVLDPIGSTVLRNLTH